MKTTRIIGQIVLATAVLLAGCGQGKQSADISAKLGGTLRVVAPAFEGSLLIDPKGDPTSLDPQREYNPVSWEMLRCCLTRTLLTHAFAAANRGGSELKPDLATALPEVSPDGLTWTFHLRHGIRYGPPLQDVEVTSPDFVRALKRMGRFGKSVDESVGSIFYNIAGYRDYEQGKSQAISGLEAPDRYTFVVRLVRQEGDLGYRFVLPGTAPIPPHPTDPSAEFGVATGHDASYGRFLISTGPYMIEGSPALTPAAPPGSQKMASGFVLGKKLTLVRNPSWVRATDPLRRAYVDRIELTVFVSKAEDATDEMSAAIDAGTFDLILDPSRPPQASVEQVRRYEADPKLGTIQFDKRDSIRFIPMRLTQRPFDDVHVRRAMNVILDRSKLVAGHGELVGDPTGHISIDSLEANTLATYDPYGSVNDQERLTRARQEMRASAYDRNHDGICDPKLCPTITAIAFARSGGQSSYEVIRRAAAKIGITVKVKLLDTGPFFAQAADPKARWGLAYFPSWGKDILSPSTFFEPLFHSNAIGVNNYSLVGASKADLRRFGASVSGVPNVDARIQQCLEAVGARQMSCWVALDQHLMEDVVPWIPYISESYVQVIPARLTAYAFDQFTALPAVVQIAVKH